MTQPEPNSCLPNVGSSASPQLTYISIYFSFLQSLRARQKEAVVISSISDIIEKHVSEMKCISYTRFSQNLTAPFENMRTVEFKMRVSLPSIMSQTSQETSAIFWKVQKVTFLSCD